MDSREKKGITKKITYTAIFVALYVVLSIMLRIPVAGHICVDLGYIALMVSAVCLGPIPSMVVGGLGVMLETLMLGQRGVSIGWIVMNLIIGYFCGLVLSKSDVNDKKSFVIKAIIVVIVSAFVGAAAKTLIDCAIYSLPLVAKIPTGLVAWGLDSAVMLIFGMPLSIGLRKRLKEFTI